MTPEPDHHRHIAVAVDGSPASELALRRAVVAAREQRAKLTIVRVIAPVTGAVALGGLAHQEVEADLERDARHDLQQSVSEMPDDVDYSVLVRHGHPANEIIQAVRDHDCDVLFMGARGLGRLGSIVLGSVSSELLHRSPVEVVVFHAPAAAA